MFPIPMQNAKGILFSKRVQPLNCFFIWRKGKCSQKTKKPANTVFAGFRYLVLPKLIDFSGERGIRTPGSLTFNGFQDRRNRPLCHLSACKIRVWRQITKYTWTAFMDGSAGSGGEITCIYEWNKLISWKQCLNGSVFIYLPKRRMHCDKLINKCIIDNSLLL